MKLLPDGGCTLTSAEADAVLTVLRRACSDVYTDTLHMGELDANLLVDIGHAYAEDMQLAETRMPELATDADRRRALAIFRNAPVVLACAA